MLLPAMFIISAGFLKSHQGNLAVLLISLAVGCLAFARPGNHVNTVEIAPRQVSVLISLIVCLFLILQPSWRPLCTERDCNTDANFEE